MLKIALSMTKFSLSKNAAQKKGSTMYLLEGDRVPLVELIKPKRIFGRILESEILHIIEISNRDRGRPQSLRPLTPPGIRDRTGRFM